MWKQLEPPKVVKLSAALAKRFAEMTPCPSDRAAQPSRLTNVRKLVAEGELRAFL